MKIKCLHCEEIYKINEGQCPACGKNGGYLQEPAMRPYGFGMLHLEETLIHDESQNQYQIKEFQTNGLVAVLVQPNEVIENFKNMRTYISNENLSEYTKKEN